MDSPQTSGDLLFDVLVKVCPIQHRLFSVVGVACIKDKHGSVAPLQVGKDLVDSFYVSFSGVSCICCHY